MAHSRENGSELPSGYLGTVNFTPPAVMDQRVVQTLVDSCQASGITHERLPSGAGHDAAVFANAGVPTAMIFIRNANGSHNPHEAMDDADFFLGAELLLEGLLTLPEMLT